MKLTNALNLPESIVRLVAPPRGWHPRSFSVTTLIKPAQMVALERAHWDELEEDVADRIWATYGTMMHRAIESMGHDNALVEERLSVEMAGVEVHGTPDLYEADGTLMDFKFGSVWSFIDGVKPEYEAQLNCYAYLLRQHGFAVTKMQIVALLRDWTKNRAHEHGYPSRQVLVLNVRDWGDGAAERFILDRLAAHGEPQPCTDKERWMRPAQWAVTKKGKKRAARLLASQAAAEAWAEANAKDGRWQAWYEVTERPGEAVRCASYCAVAAFCPQYQDEVP